LLLVGILREVAFSPFQHAENDRLILERTARALQRRGCRVRLISENEVDAAEIDAAAIFSMCQGPRATEALVEHERAGSLIINSPRAVQGCYRTRLSRIARENGLLAPTTVVATAAEPGVPPMPIGQHGLWVKRGDVHATQLEDVVRVRSVAEYAAVLADFRQRGIIEAAVQAHVVGEVVKFYGVVGTPFFRFYAESMHNVYPVALSAAHPAIEGLVRRIGLEVYGGDAVVTPQGRVVVIDVNDWPSFAYYRSEAAEVIAGHICERAARRAAPAVSARRSRAR
jgi:hypothetical protein